MTEVVEGMTKLRMSDVVSRDGGGRGCGGGRSGQDVVTRECPRRPPPMMT